MIGVRASQTLLLHQNKQCLPPWCPAPRRHPELQPSQTQLLRHPLLCTLKQKTDFVPLQCHLLRGESKDALTPHSSIYPAFAREMQGNACGSRVSFQKAALSHHTREPGQPSAAGMPAFAEKVVEASRNDPACTALQL